MAKGNAPQKGKLHRLSAQALADERLKAIEHFEELRREGRGSVGAARKAAAAFRRRCPGQKCSKSTIYIWRSRSRKSGVEGLLDGRRRASPPRPDAEERIPWLTVAEAAARIGLSRRTVQFRCHAKWAAQGLAIRRRGQWLVHSTVDPSFSAAEPQPGQVTPTAVAGNGELEGSTADLLEDVIRGVAELAVRWVRGGL